MGVDDTVAVAVGVIVGVGGTPNAIPLSFIFCGLFSASSVIVSVPDSFVTLFLAAVGLNVTETVHVAGLAASIGPQVLALTAKGSDEVIEVMLSATLFGFDNVTALGGDIVSTCTLPNDNLCGLMPIPSFAVDPHQAIELSVDPRSIKAPMTLLRAFVVSCLTVSPTCYDEQLTGTPNDTKATKDSGNQAYEATGKVFITNTT